MRRKFISMILVLLSLFLYADAKDFDYIFEQGMDGYACFRIPAIVKAKNGTLLAFAEARKKSCSDTGDIDLVMRMSKDNGQSWGKIQLIWDDGNNVCGNPAPVVEQETGQIFLLLTWNLGTDHERDIIAEKSEDTRRVFVTHSSDHGGSWDQPKEITSTTKKKNWTWYATGPVHGIQMINNDKHKGRMIIPCDHIEADTKHYYSHVIYSDDKGKTWQLGGSTLQHQVNECAVAELENGDLILNMRNYDRENKNRKISRSIDGGITWSDLSNDETLIEPICQGSILQFSEQLYFSNPASKESRKHMTLRMSLDGGESWPYKSLINKGPSAYSDLVMIDEKHIGVYYEGGRKSPYEGIAFEVIEISNMH